MATVIKAGTEGPIIKRLSTVDLADHLAEADAVIDQATRRGQALVAASQSRAAEIREHAEKTGWQCGYEKGYEQGREKGRNEAFEKAVEQFESSHAHLASTLESVVADLNGTRETLRVAAERDLLEFAVRLASKLACAIGQVDRAAVQQNFQRALALIASKSDLVLRVHAGDLATMETFAPQALKNLNEAQGLTVVSDESVGPGGCILQSPRSDVDARIETQIDELVALLVAR